MDDTQHCLDLFAGLGGFSAAFRDADGWDVTTVEIDSEHDPDICADVMELRPGDLPQADVMLASPPCTYFSLAGNHDKWDGAEPVHDAVREHITLVYHTLGLIHALSPEYWFVENPRGRMRYVLGDPAGTVHYCRYGMEAKKPTDLWGFHPHGFEYRQCSSGAGGVCHVKNSANDGTGATPSLPRDPAERSKVPYELSKQILKVVEGRQEQQTLTEVQTDG